MPKCVARVEGGDLAVPTSQARIYRVFFAFLAVPAPSQKIASCLSASDRASRRRGSWRAPIPNAPKLDRRHCVLPTALVVLRLQNVAQAEQRAWEQAECVFPACWPA